MRVSGVWRRARRVPVLAWAVVWVLLAGAVVVAPASRAAQAREVNVYSARHYDTDDRLYSDFTAQTGIKVNVIEGGEDQLIERLKAEGASSPADVLITVDAGRLWRAEQAGLLQPITSSVLESRVPASLRQPEGKWFGFAKRARIIMYAKDRVDPSELSTYEALADPKWRGRLLMRSSNAVYNQSLVGSMIEADGVEATEAWARGVVANFARDPQGADTDQIKAVAAGVGDVTVANTYYLARLVKSDKPEEREIAAKIGAFFPNQGEGDRGAHVNISGGGVVATSPNKDNAVAFLEYLTSPSAQELFASASNEYPVVEGVGIDSVVASFGTFRADEINAAKFGANNPLALQIMDRAGWK